MDKKEIRIKGWKQQFFEVRKIGDEKPLTLPPWKKFKAPWIDDGKEESHTTSD